MCRCDLHHSFEHFQAALCLFCLASFITESINIALYMFDFFLLFGVHSLLQGQLLGADRFKLAVIAGIGFYRLVLDVGDMCAQAVKEIPVV